ncbi:MAG TPA: sigma-54 dependent transcriptional regulator [Bryobacteraceae bacterium]|nr:sigma-54 dependent transcriptional regulator [Bryobacteraceae bacterium]HPQ15144.1 sigma-54 dependent transcriptional regulator [Bryobacteraceae bacterium]HPU70883.1 sigma-54 dependent transcriptional regulator [Bryobacteraceae bacterium]
MPRERILVVDDDDSLRRVTEVRLQQCGYDVLTAASGAEALEVLQKKPAALVITDLKMPGMSGLELLRRIRAEYPEVIVVMVTAFGTIETAVEAMRAGAYDYITKPVHIDEMRLVIERALEHVRLRQELQELRSSLDRKYGFENILGHSNALLSVLDMASRAAQTTSTVLIRGETGTGKELLAKAIHFNSPRRQKPFVVINCGAIPRDLLESEIFGHVKGAFTGAVAHKKGRAEAADGGTLFLDEIGELPLELQVKLLRLIQQGEIEKVGAEETTTVDVRVIAATHRNLQAMIEDGTFREDLYYRLSVIPLELPPLRERPEDIPELVEHFFVKAKEKHGRPDLVLRPALIPYFCGYRWPGNIRELENVIERLVVLTRGNEITLADLPEFLRRERPVLEEVRLELPPQGISLEAIEKELILRALKRFDWNQTQAARYLDLSRKTLIYRMEKYKIRREYYEGS